jgi:N-acetylmuramoyl-L-alanine amidase
MTFANGAPQFSDLDFIARTVWGEARSQKPDGWAAVTWVIKNRVDHPGWWGRSIRDVCTKPNQFSCWNFGDPNRDKMIALDSHDTLLSQIRLVAQEVFAGRIPDPTCGAAFYHTRAVNPTWDNAMTMTAEIGDHFFYKEAVT